MTQITVIKISFIYVLNIVSNIHGNIVSNLTFYNYIYSKFIYTQSRIKTV